MRLDKDNLYIFEINLIPEIKKAILKNSERIIASVRHVSKSGMTRHISFYYITKDKQLKDITHLIACLTGKNFKENYSNNVLVIGGCGMDMIFATLYDFYRVLFNLSYTKQTKRQTTINTRINHAACYYGTL